MNSFFSDDDSLVLYVKHFTPLGSVLYDMEKDLNFIIHELIKLEPILLDSVNISPVFLWTFVIDIF